VIAVAHIEEAWRAFIQQNWQILLIAAILAGPIITITYDYLKMRGVIR